jgi:multicomponent Na+:H+ antiporter subunit G
LSIPDALRIACVLAGVFFIFVACLGVLRLPDFYSRVHAPTKAATLGLFFLLIAVSLARPETVVVTKALLALLFIGATAPVGAHILARAAYRNGVAPMEGTTLDEYAVSVRRRKDDPAGGEPVRAHDLEPAGPVSLPARGGEGPKEPLSR